MERGHPEEHPCNGCITHIHENAYEYCCDFNQKGDCPCTNCIVKIMCRNYNMCEDGLIWSNKLLANLVVKVQQKRKIELRKMGCIDL